MRFVLDSSAIVPLLHEEDQTKNANSFFDLCHKHGVDLAISPLVRCEVGNCIVQFAKRENIDASRYLEMFMGIRFRMIPIGDQLLTFAIEISRKNGLTFYDAIHAAGAYLEDSPLVTLDKVILSRTEGSLDLSAAVELLGSI